MYVVAPGDTLSGIASRYGTGVDVIQVANGMPDPHTIRSGQQLFIPDAAGWLPAEAPVAAVREVVSGDTLFGIAQEFGVTVDDLMAANHLQDRSHVEAGWILLVPWPGVPVPDGIVPYGPPPVVDSAAPPAGSVTHTVEPKETLYSISRRYGVSIEALMAANGLVDRTHIEVGWVLVIPGT